MKLFVDINQADPEELEPLNLPFIAYVEGSYFGDNDILTPQPEEEEAGPTAAGRDGTAIAESEVHLLVLTKKELFSIIEEYEDLDIQMRAIAKRRRKYHEELI